MLKTDRQLRLLEILQQHRESVRITELSQLLHVTPITIRRDVTELARQGRVLSARGGVRLLGDTVTSETIYHLKLREEVSIKDALSRAALASIVDGATVFLDGGTTVGALAKYLLDRRLTVVTNALNVANVLSRSRHTRLILIGGTFRPESQTFLGPKATHMLQELRLDIAFMGTEGFDWDRGFEVPDESDAEFKAVAVQSAAKVVVMAAGAKLGKRYLCRFAQWDSVHLVIASSQDVGDTRPKHRTTQILWV